MRVLLDTNIALDSLVQRAPWHLESDAILKAAELKKVDVLLLSLSVATIFYVVRQVKGIPDARLAVKRCLRDIPILNVDRQTLASADALPGSDFEDNIQIAAAVIAGLDGIVTRDATGFAGSPIPVFTPADLLKLLPP